MSPTAAIVPRYGERSLSDVMPAVLHGLGVPGADDVLGLAASAQVCLLLVDGLGWSLLRAHVDAAPFLNGLACASEPLGAEPLTAGFPTTTATSLASLGTGQPPGQHGLAGYEVVAPDGESVLNLVRWDSDVDPLTYQPFETVFERAVAAGAAVTRVGPAFFDGSGLTLATQRGGEFVAAETAGERVAAAVAAVRAAPGPVLSYVYYGALDATGHRLGCTSEAWELELAHVDRFAEQLADRLPAGATLVVTADHGMVDVPSEARVDLAHDADLAAGVRLLTGEPRARYLHAETPAAVADVLACWRERLDGRMSVLPTDEAVEAGWFGPVRANVRPRLGDVVAVAVVDDVAVVDSRTTPTSVLALVGHHGALTEAEALVPLLVARP